MKKEILAIGLLVIVLAGVLVNNIILKNITGEMLILIQDIETAADKGDWQEALNGAEKVKHYWEKKSGYTHIVIRHSKLDDAAAAINSFLTEIYKRDIGGVIGTGNALMDEINGLYAMEKLKIGTIF